MRGVTFLIGSALAVAALGTTSAADERGTLSLILENDSFAGTDRNYTNGAEILYLTPAGGAPAPARWIAGTLLRAGAEDRVHAGFGLAQSIFTPQDIGVTTPLPDQHPYAGWLRLTGAVFVDTGETLDTLSLDLGIVGPASGAEWVQRNVHSTSGAPDPKGWDNQLENEFGAVLTYERKWRALAVWEGVGLQVDLIPGVGGSVGNVLTEATAGLTLRVGSDLADDYGPPRIRPSLAGSGFFRPRDDFSWYVFAGAKARAVAWNIFLDGNTFRDGPSVERRPCVADLQAGLVIQLGRWQAGFTVVGRSKEFETQEEGHILGAISLSVQL